MKNTKKLFCVLVAAIMLVCVSLFGACKDDVIVPESVTITGKPQETVIDFEENGTLQLGAKIEPEGAKNYVLEWRSSNTDVATIDDNGLVTFVAPGHTVISVNIKDTEISDMFTLSLRGQISGITITNKPDPQVERYFGETVVVNYEVTPSFVGAYNIVWNSSDEQIAVVEEGENMSAVVTMRAKTGTATITATVEGTEISDSFEVKGGGERSYFIDFDQETIEYIVNGENATAAMVTIVDQDLPENGSGNAIKFDSGTTNVRYAGISFAFPEVFKEGALYHVSYDIRILSTSKEDSNVILYTQHRSHADNLFSVTVSGTGSYHIEGSFYGVGTNKLLIFYGIEELQVSFTVDNLSVEREVISGVTITGRPENDTVQLYHQTLTLGLDVAPGYEAIWSSSDENVATISVDQSGNALVSLIATGTTTITVEIKDTGYYDSFELVVINVLESVSIEGRPANDTICLSEGSLQLIAGIAPGFDYQWISENPSVATINQDGLVQLVSVGSAVIKLTSGEFEDSFTLNITKVLIKNKPQNNELVVSDGQWQLDADLPAGFAALWESSDTDVAEISSGGLITLKSAGTTTISLSVGGGVDSFELTVLAVSFKITGKPSGPVELNVQTINTLDVEGPAGAAISWSSSDADVAQINASTGVVTLIKPGTTTISINAQFNGDNYTDSFELIVTDFENGTYMLYDFDTNTASYEPNYTGGTVTQTTSADELPEGGSGIALKYSTGSTNREYGGIVIYLPQPLVPGATYEVSFRFNLLSYSGSYPFNVFANFKDGNNSENYVFNSLGSRIIVHTLITTGACDKVTIFVQPSQQYEFTVDDLLFRRVIPTGVSILGKQDTIEFSEKTLILTPSNTYGYEIVWTSSNEAVATIEDGVVTLKGVGVTTITLSVPSLGLSDSFALEVQNTTGWYPLEYEITGYETTSIELREGDVSLQLDYELTYNGIGEVDEQNLSWQIAEGIGEEKAQIDSNGNLIFKQAGFEQGEEQDITVNLLYNDEGQYHVAASVTFNVKFTAFEPLVFALKDSSDNTYSPNELYGIDVKDGEVVIDFEYSYTGDNFQSEKVAFDIVADEQTAQMAADGVVTFKAYSFKLVKLALLYDGIEQTSATFVVYDSSVQSLGRILSDGQSTVIQASAEEAPNNLTTEAKKVNIKAGSDAWPAMRIYHQDSQKFISNTSYLILADIKMLEDGVNPAEDAKRFLFFGGGISGSQVLPLPLLGHTKTISVVVTIGAADKDFITAFRNNCDLTFSINNIRIIKLDGPATALSATLNGEQNDITGLSCNGDNKGLAMYGDSVVFANGLIDWPALNGVLNGLEEGKKYNISFDVTMLNNSVSSGQIFFRFGAEEKNTLFNPFEKQTVSFDFTASSSTLFRVFNGDNNETRCAALSCIIGPVTIQEVA